jgi:hypothetical protein
MMSLPSVRLGKQGEQEKLDACSERADGADLALPHRSYERGSLQAQEITRGLNLYLVNSAIIN